MRVEDSCFDHPMLVIIDSKKPQLLFFIVDSGAKGPAVHATKNGLSEESLRATFESTTWVIEAAISTAMAFWHRMNMNDLLSAGR